MTASWSLVACILAGMALAYTVGLRRSLAVAGGAPRSLHSLPEHHGVLLALWCGVPALAVFALWSVLERPVLHLLLERELPPALRDLSPGAHSLLMNELTRATGS